jgi:ABC-2 type transport system permease protein
MADSPATAATIRRGWRIARITPVGQLLVPPRLTATAIQMAVQIFLVVCLWHSLYEQTGNTAGLSERQATGYAILAVLAARVRALDRRSSRDSIAQHLRQGTVIYLFLRPLSPSRYHLLRALGDQLYGLAWFTAGLLCCLVLGVLMVPPSILAGVIWAVSFMLGQLVLYRLALIIDLLCFWTLRNSAALQILQFTQNLLSGSYAPLWFFPGWFVAAGMYLPFQATLNVPLSIYIGRIPVADSGGYMLVQLVWVIALTAQSRWMWLRVGDRLIVQGG